MKSFESPVERMMMYEIYNQKLKLNNNKNYVYNDSYVNKIFKSEKNVKKRILKK